MQESVTDNLAPNNNGGSLIIGARNSGNNGPQWDGLIDDVAIWNSVISAADISAVGTGTLANSSTLTSPAQAYYDFEDPITGSTTTNRGIGGLAGADATISGITPTLVPEPSSLIAMMLGLGGFIWVRRKRS